MYRNLNFYGFHRVQRKYQNILRDFITEYLEIDYGIEFPNIHIFGKRNKKRSRPNGAKFIYQDDPLFAKHLKGNSYRINRQFSEKDEQERKSIYPIIEDLKRKGEEGKLVREFHN